MSRGKKYKSSTGKMFDRQDALLAPSEAVDLVKSLGQAPASTRPSSWPSGSGVDPRKADQIVRGTLSLPAGHRPARPGGGVRRR